MSIGAVTKAFVEVRVTFRSATVSLSQGRAVDPQEEIQRMTIENLGHTAPTSTGIAIPTGPYELRPELTTVAFEAKKFGVFTIRGTMRLVSGAFSVADPVERSTLHVVLDADSFTTRMRKRDEHVKSAKLLNTVAYPEIEFDSTEVAPRPDGTWDVHGMLEVHGQVAPAVLTVTSTTVESGLVRLGATARVNRREFGVTALRAAASALIDLRIEAVATPLR
jgi:polyisoprenoid-binding protein YceI